MQCVTGDKKSIASSLVWAGVILLGAYLSQGEDYAFMALIFATISWLSQTKNSCRRFTCSQ